MSNPLNENLFLAISTNDVEQVAATLDAGADLEVQRRLGRLTHTPLVWAAKHGHVHVVELLLDRGAQVDGADSLGRSALHLAGRFGWVQVVELLVSRGADLEQQDLGRRTALVWALQHGKHDVATWLLDRGARVGGMGWDGRTVLRTAVYGGYPDLGRLLQHAQVVEMVDAVGGQYERTALHEAAERGRFVHVRQLLDAGATVGAKDMYGVTPLHLASKMGHVEVMRELLRRGADVNAVMCAPYASTPLMSAANASDCEPQAVQVVRLLLEYGADQSRTSSHGQTARDIADYMNSEVVEVLDTYFPVKLQMEQLLLGMHGHEDSPLTRFAAHSAFEPKVLSIVAAFHSGKSSPAFEQLQREAGE